jgi:hypothetical protein
MCGRFTLRSSPAVIAQEFGLFDLPDLSVVPLDPFPQNSGNKSQKSVACKGSFDVIPPREKT